MSPFDAPGVWIVEKEPGSRPIQGVGTAVAGFVGRAPIAPGKDDRGPLLVSNWNQFKRACGDLTEGFPMTYSVYGFFQNGGGACFISRVGVAEEQPLVADIPSADDPATNALSISVSGESGPLAIEVAAGEAEAYALVLRSNEQELARWSSDDVGRRKALAIPDRTETKLTVNERARGIRPAPGSYPLILAAGAQLSAGDYVGDVEARSGLGGLEAIDEVTMLVAPDVMVPGPAGKPDLALAQAVQGAMCDQCFRLKDRMAILDPPPGLSPQQILEWRDGSGLDSPFAALYYPWVGVYDPTGSTPRFLPPSGHMAGVWSRSDALRGVHKAPANEPISGVAALETQVTRSEQALLNPKGINVVRAFPGTGIRVWGARTTSLTDRQWQYVNVRRVFNYIEESIAEGTQWVVFEPNDADLWQRIVRTVSSFLLVTWRDGALFGRKPEEAFFVKCDETTNTPETIEQGRVVIEIGLAPVKPAEFVIFEIAQYPGGALVSE